MSSTTLIQNPSLGQTIAVMCTKANEAKKTLRPLAARICAGLEPGDYNSEILALYGWVRRNIRYARDIQNVEYVQAPARLLESKTGDCDDIACLLAALTMAMGNEARFLVVGFENRQPSHVLCQVAVQAGQAGGGNTTGAKAWVTLDPVADENTPQMHSRVRMAQAYPCGASEGVGGTGMQHSATPRFADANSGSGQVFSVFDPYARKYNYFAGPGNSANYGARGTKFRALTQQPSGNKEMGPIGFAPEALALALPSTVRRVGSGFEARGIVAVPSVGASVGGLGRVPVLVAPTLGLGLGPTLVDDVVVVKSSFGAMVAAAAIAAVVGAVVTRMLR